MSIRHLRYYGFAFAGCLAFAGPVNALADTGGVSGTLRFYNKNGSYCPSLVPPVCTGATYTEGQFDAYVGIPEADILLRRVADDDIIGVGETDADGAYTMAWSYPTPGVQQVYIQVRFRHKDGRFFIHSNPDHLQYVYDSDPFSANPGVTVTSDHQWGESTSPGEIANVYWAAFKVWQQRLSESSTFVLYYTDVDIIAFDDPMNPKCSSSCARPWFKLMADPPDWAEQKLTVLLGSSAATPFSPQERIMHELGHIADFLSGPQQGYRRGWLEAEHPDGIGEDDCRDSRGWNYDTKEFRSKAFKESLASFIAAGTLYNDYAPNARTCVSDGTNPSTENCWVTATPLLLEPSKYTTGCSDASRQEGREIRHHLRYLWDIYDESNEDLDDTDLTMVDVFDSLSHHPCSNYPECFGGGEIHPQYSAMSSDLSEAEAEPGGEDDAHAWMFHLNMLNEYPPAYAVDGPYYNNCLSQFLLLTEDGCEPP